MDFNFEPITKATKWGARLKEGVYLTKYHLRLGDDTAVLLRELVKKHDPELIRDDNGFYLSIEVDIEKKALRFAPSNDGLTFGIDKAKGNMGYFIGGHPVGLARMHLPHGVYKPVPGYDNVFQLEDNVPMNGKVVVDVKEFRQKAPSSTEEEKSTGFERGDKVTWVKQDGSAVDGVVRTFYKQNATGRIVIKFESEDGKMHEVVSTNLILK